jgi:hypothetical protein
LERIEEMAGAGLGRLPLKKFVIKEDGQENKKRKKEVQALEENQVGEQDGGQAQI